MSKVAKVQNKKKKNERKDNPFESRSQKLKFDVLGKKVIGRDVRLSQSRSRAEQKVIENIFSYYLMQYNNIRRLILAH